MSNTSEKSSAVVERLAYTRSELCSSLNISPITLWRLERRGLIRSVPGVRHKIFSVAEVQRFLAGGAA